MVDLHSKGSIVTDSVLEFDTTNGTSPNVTDVKDTLVKAIENGNFSLAINSSSISATDITETNGQCIYRFIFFLLDTCLLHCEPFKGRT